MSVSPSLAFEEEGKRTRIEQSLTLETGIHPNSSKKLDRLCRETNVYPFNVIHIILLLLVATEKVGIIEIGPSKLKTMTNLTENLYFTYGFTFD